MKTENYRSPADQAKARAVRAMWAARDALEALRQLQPQDYEPPDEHTTPTEHWQFHRALVCDGLALARIICHFADVIHNETDMGDGSEQDDHLDQEEGGADQPAVVVEGADDFEQTIADRHGPTIQRWVRVVALMQAARKGIHGFTGGPDADLIALMNDYYTGTPGLAAPGRPEHHELDAKTMYEQSFALAIHLETWLVAAESYLPFPIRDAAVR